MSPPPPPPPHTHTHTHVRTHTYAHTRTHTHVRTHARVFDPQLGRGVGKKTFDEFKAALVYAQSRNLRGKEEWEAW